MDQQHTAPLETAYGSGVSACYPRTGRRRLLAAIASALIPGAGQWILRCRQRAVLFFCILFSILILHYAFRLPASSAGLLGVMLSLFVLSVFASSDSFNCQSPLYRPASRRWWLLAPVLAIFAGYAQALVYADLMGFRPYIAHSASMAPTIAERDRIIADTHAFWNTPPRAGDAIVFRKNGILLIKRMVGCGKTTIAGRGKTIFVDGNELSEPYANYVGAIPPELESFGPVTVPDGKCFVAGDNRNYSYDSRLPEFGLIDRRDILGKALYVYRAADGTMGRRIQ